jgi:probable aminopeptidase NPEPL1
MKTQIIFGSPKSEVKTELFLLSKGSWTNVKEEIESKLNGKTKGQIGGDLFSTSNPPSSVSLWHELNNEKKEYQQIILSQYENKLSRNMGYIRSDLILKEIVKHIPKSGCASVTICVKDKKEAFAAGLEASRGFPLYNQKTSKKENKDGEKEETNDRTIFISFLIENKEENQVNIQELQILSDNIRNTQRMVDTPPSELNTTEFVKEAQDLATSLNNNSPLAKVEIKVISGEDLKAQGFGGIYGVGKAAECPPALVVLSYCPEKADKTVALVGKGIVYDSGGLSLKPTTGMCHMKTDMGGAAAVLNSFASVVQNKLNVRVHALLCLAENAIGPKAFRNDDILHMYSGKTVEVNNTDAEGRLVLGDGVAYASQHLNPNIVINIATLTGAQLVTTGIVHAGVLTPLETTEDRALDAGKTTGDLVFPFLYAREILMSNFDSKVADMKNSVKDRSNAQASCAGHFVESHLHADYKGEWLHVDIAGPSYQNERGTGFGTALLYQITKDY